MLKNPKLSVVIPIYNSSEFLPQTLDCFINQSSKDFVVLLIDDGSTDNSGDIAKEFAKKYPDLFKYYFQQNKGLGGARNTGLKLVETDYVMFFDSDDLIANKAIENINNFIGQISSDVDIIFFNPVIYDQTAGTYFKWHDEELIKKIFASKNELVPKDHSLIYECEASVCRCVFKKDIFVNNNISFLEKCCWEDVNVHFQLLHFSKKISFLDYMGAYYYRTNNPKSITSSNGKKRLDIFRVLDEVNKYFADKTWTKKEKASMLGFLANYIYWFLKVIEDEYRKELVVGLHNYLKQYSCCVVRRFFFKSNQSLRNKLMIVFLRNRFAYKILISKETISKFMRVFKKIKRIFRK